MTRWRDITHEHTEQFRPENSRKALNIPIVELKENRPLLLFGSLSLASTIASAILSIPLIVTFVDTGLVPRLPTAILVAGLVVLSLLFLALIN